MRPTLSRETIDILGRALATTEPSPCTLARRHALRAKTARDAEAKKDGERDSKAPVKVVAKGDVGR